MKTILVPPAINRGDTLGVIAPAGQLKDSDQFSAGMKILKDMGFFLKYPRELWPGNDYLAADDASRGREFNQLLCDPEVKGFVSLRGGFGCLRMLDQIDLQQVRVHPKYLLGFSDITILQNYLYAKTGLISLHGPVVTSLSSQNETALRRLYRCLTGRWHQPLELPELQVLQGGATVIAPLIGGNLASLTTMLGTPYDFDWSGTIVLLEDVNEPLYKIDRMLSQLYFAGKFSRVAGIILGSFTYLPEMEQQSPDHYLQAIGSRMLELVGGRNIPVWAKMPAGHCLANLTLPLGATAVMDSKRGLLRFLPAHESV